MKKLLPLGIFLIYWFIFPFGVKDEFVPSLLSVQQVPERVDAQLDAVPLFPFSGPGRCGYADAEGYVISSFASDIFVSNAGGYTLLSELPSNYTLYNLTGAVISSMNLNGTPVFDEKGIFFIGSFSRMLKAYTKSGQFSWEKRFSDPVTVFISTDSFICVGLSTGYFYLLDRKGNFIFEKHFNYTEIDCIYGAAVSEDGRRIAVVHGNSPQFLHIIEKVGDRGHEYKDLAIHELSSTFTKNIFMQFAQDDDVLALEINSGIGFYSIKKERLKKLNVEGDFEDGILTNKGKFFFFSIRKNDSSHLVYTDLKTLKLNHTLNAGNFISFAGNDNRILVYVTQDDRERGGFNIPSVYLYDLERK